MLVLTDKVEFSKQFPTFAIPRLPLAGDFEPAGPTLAEGATYFAGLIDTGAPYVVIPFRVHRDKGQIKIHRDLGMQPYRIGSSREAPVCQRFAEVGIRFTCKNAAGAYFFWPSNYVRAKAYLLDANQQPSLRALVGLDVLLDNFVLHLEKDNIVLSAR
jgi:hypothetical protein